MSAQAVPTIAADAPQADHGDAASSSKKGQHSRASSLLPSLNSLGSFLASAGGLNHSNAGGNSSGVPPSASGGLSTDAELMIADPTPTEWADELSPTKEIFRKDSTEPLSRPSPRNLSDEVRFRGNVKPDGRNDKSDKQSSIAFPAPTPPSGPLLKELEGADQRPPGSRTSSSASTARDSESTLARFVHSPEPTASTISSSIDTPATSVRDSPRALAKDAQLPPSASPPPPSESTIKAEHQSSASTLDADPSRRSNQTLPRSFAATRSPASYTKGSVSETNAEGSTLGRTSSLTGSSERKAAKQLEDALASDQKTARRGAGLRARSINGLRGLAAAWVPARFNPTSLPSSSASSASSNDDDSSLSSSNTRRRDGTALVPASNDKTMVRHGGNDVKRPVKLDRRRLDKAVSLAVEAAQAAEEDERLWEEKRARRAAQKAASSQADKARPALKSAWSQQGRNSDNRQVARHSDADASLTSDEEQDDQDDDDLGFSLDLYISSLGYLIAAISDKEASGLSDKQRQDIQKRLEEGMSKLGFDAKAELEKAEAMKRELELEREKLQIQRQMEASPAAANIIHHHYHTTVPAHSSMFGDATFSRAHAAAKASSRGSSSLAGKISSSVLDVGLHIGAGALSALSANLSAIAPGGGRKASSGSPSSKASGMEDPRITDLDNDEDLKSMSEAGAQPMDASPQPGASQPGSGAATPRTAWTRAISQNSKQWELAVAFASTAASALASSLGAVARDPQPQSTSTAVTSTDPIGNGPLTHEQQVYLARYGHLDGAPDSTETAEDRLILLSASLARSLKRSPLPTQLYQLLRQMVSILAAIDAKYSLTEKGTQLAVRETSRAMRFVRRHDLHVKAVRVAWAAAEAAVAALEAYRDEKGWIEAQQQQRIAAAQGSPFNAILEGGGTTPVYSGSPPDGGNVPLAIADKTLEAQIDDAEAKILKAAAAQVGKEKKRTGVKV